MSKVSIAITTSSVSLPSGVKAGKMRISLFQDGELLDFKDVTGSSAEFDAVEHRRNAMFDDDTLTDEANTAIREEQAPLVDRLCNLQAVTIEGMRARARSLVLYDDEVLERRTIYTNDRLVAAVLRDLIGEAGA